MLPSPSQKSTKPSRTRKLIATAALLGVSLVVALLLSEGLVRLAAPQTLVRAYIQPDERLGNIIRPNQDFYDNRNPELFSYHVRSNAQGMRMDEDLDPSPKRLKIAMLGDSYVFGWGVDIEQAFAQHIKQHIESHHRQLQLLNMGVGAYSSGHVSKQIRQRSQELQLSGVVYFMNANDLADNINQSSNYQVTAFTVGDQGEIQLHDKLVYSPLKRFVLNHIPLYTWLNQHSQLFILFKSLFKPADQNAPHIQIDVRDIPPKQRQLAQQVSLAHLQRLALQCQLRQLPLQVIWIPSAQELFAAQEPALFKTFKTQAAASAKSYGYRFDDPTKAIKASLKSQAGFTQKTAIYFPEGHYNSQGNALYAKHVTPLIDAFVRRFDR